MSRQIDSHQHFWRYVPEEYPWIDDSLPPLRRDFLPRDLQRELAAAGVDAAIAVQARQSLEETEFLLDLGREFSNCAAVIGWVPFTEPDIPQILERLASHPLFRGVRHVLQDEPDRHYMLRENFHRGIRALKAHKLVYDILIRESQLKAATVLVDQHPEQIFVLDHLGKPSIKSGKIDPWSRNIRELARRENVQAKLSGLVTEADHSRWTSSHLEPYVEVALEAFGTKRLLFGSDWPVCLAASTYQDWKKTIDHLLRPLSLDERADIMGNNAARIYRLA